MSLAPLLHRLLLLLPPPPMPLPPKLLPSLWRRCLRRRRLSAFGFVACFR